MKLQTTGMEFASEMVIKSTMKGLKIGETPITLHKDGRSRPPHLRSWRDGWRHLRFMLLFSPRWLFLMPGAILTLLGLTGLALLSRSPITLGSVTLDAGSMAVFAMAMLLGSQLLAFACFTKVFAIAEGLLPEDRKFSNLFRYFTLEVGIVFGLALLLGGTFSLAQAALHWKAVDFGPLSYSENLRQIILAVTLISAGMQTIFSSFFLSVLGLKISNRTPPSPQ